MESRRGHKQLLREISYGMRREHEQVMAEKREGHQEMKDELANTHLESRQEVEKELGKRIANLRQVFSRELEAYNASTQDGRREFDDLRERDRVTSKAIAQQTKQLRGLHEQVIIKSKAQVFLGIFF